MRFARHRRWIVVLAALLIAGACAGDDGSTTAPDTGGSGKSDSSNGSSKSDGKDAKTAPTGTALSSEDLVTLAEQFDDQPLTGGQEAPRLYKWVNDDVALFIQLDDPDPAAATALQYIGVSVKGTFCAESQPGGPDGGFPHFHHLDAADYGEGHGGPAGTPGYWLSWVAVDNFESFDGRQVEPGVDYDFAPTPEPPDCGKNKAKPKFDGPGAGKLDPQEAQDLAAFFDDELLTGGQEPPRLYKWMNEKVALFAQFDDLEKPTSLPMIGISVASEFCADQQPTEDFPHFHQWHAANYDEGHGSSPGDEGAWLLWLATESFQMGDDGPQVQPGVFRDMSPTPAPDC